MIINSTYFKGDIYIPQAQKSISDEITEAGEEIIGIINEYSEECLILCLGLPLFLELENVLDSSRENGLIEGVDQKWDWLLNGLPSYIDSKGKTTRWKGLRYKSSKLESAEYDTSLIAYYVYWFYQRKIFTSTTGIGENIPKAKNAEVISPRSKVTTAWRKFYKLTVGCKPTPTVIYKNGLRSVDYYKGSLENSLFKFINDMNSLDTPLYSSFIENDITNLNQFDL